MHLIARMLELSSKWYDWYCVMPFLACCVALIGVLCFGRLLQSPKWSFVGIIVKKMFLCLVYHGLLLVEFKSKICRSSSSKIINLSFLWGNLWKLKCYRKYLLLHLIVFVKCIHAAIKDIYGLLYSDYHDRQAIFNQSVWTDIFSIQVSLPWLS